MQSGNLDAQVKSAQAQVTAAAERLKRDQARLDVTLRGATDEDIQQAQAGVDQARQQVMKARQPYTASDLQQQAQLETAELGLNETTVVAPVDGMISERLVAPGALR